MIYIFNRYGRMIGLAFHQRPVPAPAEKKFYDARGKLIASVLT
jgi:hypothetical protein